MDDLLTTLAPYITNRVIKKGTTIFYQGEIPRQAFIVRKGYVRAYTITSSGSERTVALFSRNDLFPLPWLSDQAKTTLFYYEAGSDSEVACVSKEVLNKTVAESSDFSALLLKYAMKEYTALMMRVTALEQSNAAEKIAYTFYYLLIRHGVERRPGEFTINIKMTQSMIASLVGLTRESTAVNISKLKDRGVVTYQNFIYVVNKPNLEKFIGEDNFKELTLK